MRGTLVGEEVRVGEGDLPRVSAGATDGLVNGSGEPATWLELRPPVPPGSGAFFFPGDWRSLPH